MRFAEQQLRAADDADERPRWGRSGDGVGTEWGRSGDGVNEAMCSDPSGFAPRADARRRNPISSSSPGARSPDRHRERSAVLLRRSAARPCRSQEAAPEPRPGARTPDQRRERSAPLPRRSAAGRCRSAKRSAQSAKRPSPSLRPREARQRLPDPVDRGLGVPAVATVVEEGEGDDLAVLGRRVSGESDHRIGGAGLRVEVPLGR